MKVKELIETLSKLDPEIEVVLYRQGWYNAPSYSTSRISVSPGYLVRDPEKPHNFYTKMAGNGIFVDEPSAHKVMDDGREFLDLSSPTIHPAVQINLPRY